MTTPNNDPIYTKTPNVAWVVAITGANTAKDGSGTVSTIFTAGANGSFVEKIRLKPAGTNIPSALRVFINNGSTNATAANNSLYADISLPATTNSETAGQPDFEIPLNIPLPAGYKLNVVLATAVSAGWIPTAVGGDY